VRVVAERPQLLLAEVTPAAGDRERHYHAVTDLQLRVLLPDLDDFAHELVAEDVARLHGRDVAVVQMEVGTGHGGRPDPYDRVARVQDLRIGNSLDPDVVGRVPDKCLHKNPLV